MLLGRCTGMAEIGVVTEPAQVLEAAHLFDREPTLGRATGFLRGEGNHLLFAYEGEDAVGFVSGIEVAHPDKPTEMMLNELAVAVDHRQRGVGTGLVVALARRAGEVGCAAMWAPTEMVNDVARATYLAAGAVIDPAAIATWELS